MRLTYLTYPFEFYLDLANVILVGVAIVFALYMIPLTGKARAWLLFSAALVFLLLERLFELLSYIGILFDQATLEVARDIIDLFMTGCLFGSVYYIRGIFLERKLAAETLHTTNIQLSLFRKLLDNSSDAIKVIDPITARFLDVNEKACRDLGYSREEMLSMSVFDIDPNLSPDIKKMLDEQIQKSGTALYESIHRRKDGSTFAVEVSIGSANVDKPYGLRIARDITERKKLELDREQYLKFFMLSINPMCIADPHGCLKQVNPAFVQLTGYSESELIAKPFLEFVLPEDRQRTDDEMKLQVESRPTLHFDNRYLCKNGTEIDLSWTAYYDKHDGTSYATAIDITERKRMEGVLRKSEAEFRTLTEAMPQIVWITRPDGWNIYFNQQWMNYTGLTLEESLGHGWSKPFHPDDQQRAWDAWQQATKTNGIYSVESRLRRADGIYRWWLVRGVPLQDADGNTLKWLGTYTDINDIKMADLEISRINLELRESERRFSDLLENVELVSVMRDSEERITYCNKFLLRLTGWKYEEIIGRNWVELFVPPEIAKQKKKVFAELLLNKPEARHYESEILTRSGERRLIHWNNSVLRSGDGDVIGTASIGENITEHKNVEAALHEKELLLLESQRIAHFGSWRYELSGKLTWSDEAYRIFGVSKDTFTPNVESLLNLIHPDNRLAMQAWIGACVAGTKPDELAFRIIMPDDTVRMLSGYGELQYDDFNMPTHLIGIVHDITERKHAEDALRKSEEQYRLIVETAQEGIWIIDENNKTTFANNKIAELLGYTVEEMHGMSLFDFMDEAGKAISVVNVERRRQGITEQHDFKFQRKDGTDLWVIIETNPMVNEDGEYVGALAMITDITARVRSQSQLIEQLDELRRWHEVTSGREERILDLKHEVNDLLSQTGKYPRYPSAESQDKTEK